MGPGHVAREQVRYRVAESDPPGEPTRPAHGGKARLVRSRKVGEEVVIPGDSCVTVVAIQGTRVRLGITGPPRSGWTARRSTSGSRLSSKENAACQAHRRVTASRSTT